MQTGFEQQENSKTIAAQKQILGLQQSAIATHRFLNVVIGTAATLAAIVALLLYRANRQKQRIMALLHQKVRERTQSLEESLLTLQRTHEVQLQFLSKASRDLREPLLTLKGLFNLLKADAESPAALRHDLVALDRSLIILADTIAKLETRDNR